MAVLRRIGPDDYELDYGTMTFSLRYTERGLVSLGGGSSSFAIDDRDWDDYCRQAEIEAGSLLSELAAFELETEAETDLPRVLRVCETEAERWISTRPYDWRSLTPRGLEEIVAELLSGFGFSVELTPKSRDGGYDIFAVRRDVIGLENLYLIECKHTDVGRKVQVAPVRALYGVKLQQRADHGIIVTDYRFTKGAWAFANDPHVWNLHLKDRDALLAWLDQYNALKTGKRRGAPGTTTA